MPIVTKEMMEEAKGKRGNYTVGQVRLARVLCMGRKGPMKRLIGMDISEPVWQQFMDYANAPIKKKKKKRNREFTGVYSPKFYLCRDWRELRVKVLEKYGCKCMMCGRSPKDHGVVLHVDHIKPKSKYPHLALVEDNLQILCECCNIGKSNRYETDWRPDLDEESDTDDELQLVFAANQVL